MFDQMKSMGALASLFKDKERMRELGEQFRRRLEELTATGEAGGGAVRVTVNGTMQVLDVQLSSALAEGTGDGDARETAEQLIREATNDALRQARDMAHQEASSMARELGLPDMPGLSGLLS